VAKLRKHYYSGSRIDNVKNIHDNLSYYSRRVETTCWVILENSIKTVYKSLRLPETENLKINVLVFPHSNAIGGHAHRNFVLDLLEDEGEDWFYNLDDDNILHTGFIDFFLNDSTLEDFDAALVARVLANGTLRWQANADLIKVNHVYTPKCLYKTKILNGGLRFAENYCGDGYFID